MAPGTMRSAELEDHEFLIARVGGEFLVADARFPHLGGHLPKGELDGTVVTCPRHGPRFDLTDGHVIRWTDWTWPVCTVAELARHRRPLRVYASRVDGGRLWVGPQKLPPAEE